MIQLATERVGRRPEAILEMAADGSSRQYFRLLSGDGGTMVGAIGPDHEENRAFLSFARTFRELGLPVPEIFAEDREAGVWLEEDLGDTTLFKALSDARTGVGEGPASFRDNPFPSEGEVLFRKALAVLPRFQVEGHEVIDYLSLIHISEPTRQVLVSRMPSAA